MEKKHKITATKQLKLWALVEKITKDQLEEWVHSVIDKLLKQKAGKRTLVALKGIDKHISENSNMTCRAGCSACCHQQINISDSEADLIMEEVNKRSIVLDKVKLSRQANWDKKDYYHKKNRPHASCVFLQDNKCSIYNQRPAVCRSYTVSSNPSFCNTKYRHKHTNLEIIVNGKAEIITSAIWSMGGKIDSLPRQLLSRLTF